MKILILGSNGMLGSDCKNILSKDYEVIAPERKDLDIVSWDVAIETMQQISPDIVLNCAGFTDVDACETEAYTVRKINVEGPRNLAQGSARFNCKLIHISSDYVFSGLKNIPQPYFEDDPVDPISAYGKSKAESEVAVKENAPNYIIIRSAWLYGIKGDNFIKSILTKAVKNPKKPLVLVDDQFGSPTWTFRLALQIKELIKNDTKGTYHATAEGYCSPLEYAQFILDKLNLKVSVESYSMNDYPHTAKRPFNCILENRLLKNQGLNIMPDWKKDLEIFLDRFDKELIQIAKA
jgi:dTDP-4-dehydrorhamnose reductase